MFNFIFRYHFNVVINLTIHKDKNLIGLKTKSVFLRLKI